MEQQQLDKFLFFAGKTPVRKPYVYKRGPHAKTLIRDSQHYVAKKSNSPYPKELEGYWVAKLELLGSIFDNQDHESGHCTCKCTPTPKQNPTYQPDDKRRKRHNPRGRPFAHIQTEEGD